MEGRGRRQVEKQRAREQRDQVEASKKDYQKLWLEIKEFEFPVRPEDREQFFLSEISKGEQLINRGTFRPMLFWSADVTCRSVTISVRCKTFL